MSQPIAIDGGDYLVCPAAWPQPEGYARLGTSETRWLLRDWTQRGAWSSAGALLRGLGGWSSTEAPYEAAGDELALRFDEYTAELVLYRRLRISVALDLSDVEEVVDLGDAAELVSEPELHWVEITFHDAAGEPLANAQVRIERPDGVTHEGRTNAAGVLRVSDIAVAGSCKVTFLELEACAREHFQVAS